MNKTDPNHIPKPWKILTTKDISPSKWFPLEERTYELPDGTIVEDFTVCTIEDAGMVIPITPENEVIFAQQFKQGANRLTLEFPGGRIEKHHKNIEETAYAELLEETGIVAKDLIKIGETFTFPTKGTEKVTTYLMKNARVTEPKQLDEHENIRLVYVPLAEVDSLIVSGEINCSPTIAAWHLLQLKFPQLMSGK